MADPVTLSDAVKQDHRDLEEAYNRILGAPNDDEKTRWQNQFVWELARHSIGEELVVYPQFEKKLPNGKQMADKDRKEHMAVKEHLYKFQKLKVKDPEFEPTLKALWGDLIQHIKEEEEEDMPALEKALGRDASAELKGSFIRTKKFVPTRSHPNAPDKPPFETVAGLMAAPIDHLMDVFKKFPKEAKSELPP